MKTTTEQQCAEAMARIVKHINAACGQHRRAIRSLFQKARDDANQTATVWTRPESIRSQREKLASNFDALAVETANVIKRDAKRDALGLAYAVQGVQEHVKGDRNLVVGRVHGFSPKSRSVAA